MKVESEKAGLKLNIQKMKISDSGQFNLWFYDDTKVMNLVEIILQSLNFGHLLR